MNIIGGLDTPSSGEVNYDPGTRFGYVFQDENFIFALSVKDNLALVSSDEAAIEKILNEVGLIAKIDTPISLMSKGERARLAIAKCLLQGANVLLLDEPTGNLDSANSDIVLSLLEEVSKTHLVIVVSHDEESARTYADVILHLADGKLVSTEALKELPTSVAPTSKGEDSSRIPFQIGWHYLWKKIFSRRGKMILSLINLIFTSTFLVLSLTLLDQNHESLFVNSLSDFSDPILVQKGYSSKLLDSSANGVDYYDEIKGRGVKKPLICFNDGTSDNSFSFYLLNEDVLPSKPWASLGDYEGAFPASYLSDARTLGSTLTLYDDIPLKIAVAFDPDSLPNDAPYDSPNFSFVFVNETTYCQLHASAGWLEGPDPLFRTGDRVGYRRYSSSIGLKAGREPSGDNEVVVTQTFLNEGWPKGDASLLLDKEFPLSAGNAIVNPLDRLFSSVKVVGITQEDGLYSLRFGAAFAQKAAPIFDKDGLYYLGSKDAAKLLPLVDEGRLSFLYLSAEEKTAALGFFQLLSFASSTANVWICLGVVFSVMALISLLLYCFDNIKTNEKDIALLKIEGKSSGSITLIYGQMNLAIGVLAFPVTCLLSFLGLLGLDNVSHRLFGLPNHVLAFSWIGAGLALLLLLVVPLIVTLIALPKIKTKNAAEIFKRNLV